MSLVPIPDVCELCGAHDFSSYSIGPLDAKIVVVTNRKSSGRFQDALDLELKEMGLDVSQVLFTPVIKCREFDISLTTKQLKEHAAEYLIPELEEYPRDFILCLGNEALQTITGKSGITKYRGKPFDVLGGKTVAMGTLSPSAINRNPGQKPGYLADLRLFVNRTKDLVDTFPQPNYLVVDDKEKLKKLFKILSMTDEMSIDIETYAPGGEYYMETGRMVSVAGTNIVIDSFGAKKRVVWALPLWHPQSPWRGNWQRIVEMLGKYIHKIRVVIAHNASFDCKWLIWFGCKLYPTFDTMLAIALLNENVQKGLKPQAMARLGVEPWGIDTGDLTKYPIADVLHYNVLDTWYTYHIKLQLEEELNQDLRLKRIFELETMPAQSDLIDSEIRGAWIDVARLKKRTPIAQKRLSDINTAIAEAAGIAMSEEHAKELIAWSTPGDGRPTSIDQWCWPGHPDWPTQIKGKRELPLAVNFNASRFAKWMLFEWLGLPVLAQGKVKPDGSPGDPSMAEDVLKHIAIDFPHPAVDRMLERVTKQKQLAAFFNPYNELYDDDHRIHTNFKLAGTVTGRLSSGKADADKISGSKGKLRGVNLQQVPRDPFIRGLFGAPPGWTFVEADFSQIELRIGAYLADETTMKHIYASGGDIHTSTAARVTGLPESQVTSKIRKEVGKPVNFGFLYGMGWRKFIETAFNSYGSVFTELEAQGARMAYFDLYPKLLPWHAKQRRLVNKYGRVVSPLGRIRHLPDIYSPDQGVRAEAERQAINSPVQGFGSDLAVIAMIRINRILRKKGWDQYAHCLGLVHDAINFEIRNDYVSRVIPIIKKCMEDMDYLYKQFGTVVDIPIVADVALGAWWGNKFELTDEQVYDDGFVNQKVLEIADMRKLDKMISGIAA
ncbi:DNA polymerase I [Microbacterium phage Triscuit]|nr:DNA polymerase I [Microbacterium phage Triscuit]